MEREYLKRPIESSRRGRGKFILGVLDFPPYFSVSFSNQGKFLLSQFYAILKDKYGIDALHRRTGRNLYCLKNYLDGKQDSILVKTLEDIKWYLDTYDIPISFYSIEIEIVFIYSGSGKRTAFKARFPLDLRNPLFGYLIGLSLDSAIKQFTFTNSNQDFLNQALSKLRSFGFIDCTVKRNKGDSKRIYLGALATNLMRLSGFDVSRPQIEANNSLPNWFIEMAPKSFHEMLLSATIDTEGNIGKRFVRISQNVSHLKRTVKKISLDTFEVVPVYNTSYVFLLNKEKGEGLKQSLKKEPPLLLVSLKHLLAKYGVDSKMQLSKVYIKKNSILCSSWVLAIYGKRNLEKIYDLTKRHSIKKEKLKNLLKHYVRKCSAGRNKRGAYFIETVKNATKPGEPFTSKMILDKTKMNRKTLLGNIQYLASLNLLKNVGKEGKFKRWQLVNQ